MNARYLLGLHPEPETTGIKEILVKGASRTLAILALLLLALALATPTSAGRLPPAEALPNTNPDGWAATTIGASGLTPPPIVLPPDTNPYGASYGEWGARWWQWVFAQPTDRNPLTDQTGAFCAVDQSGPVWFLTGDIATRTCTVPIGKALFFPVASEAYVLFPWDPNDTPELAREITKRDVDTAFAMTVTVDGVSLPILETYRVQSPALGSVPETFTVTLPAKNIMDIPAGPYQTVADGYYMMLAPLPAGTHNVRIRAMLYAVYPDHSDLYEIDAQYTLMVPSTVVYLPLMSR